MPNSLDKPSYTRLGKDERKVINYYREQGESIREIARRVKRPASTVSRELKRNNNYQVRKNEDPVKLADQRAQEKFHTLDKV